MSMKAIKDVYSAQQALPPAVRTATSNSSAIDFANAIENVILVESGAITDGNHTPKVQDSNDGATWADVDPSLLVGALGNIAANAVQKISYIGAKRYARIVTTVAGATNGGAYSVTALVRPRKQPAA